MDAIRAAGGEVLALAAIVDRTEGGAAFDVPFHALTEIAFPTYAEDELPEALAAVPVSKPGSRN